MNMSITIYAVRASVDRSGAKIQVTAVQADECPTTYKVLGSAPLYVGKHPKRSRIMALDTWWINAVDKVHYCTLCLDGQKQQAIELVRNACMAEIKRMSEAVQMLTDKSNEWSVEEK